MPQNQNLIQCVLARLIVDEPECGKDEELNFHGVLRESNLGNRGPKRLPSGAVYVELRRSLGMASRKENVLDSGPS